MRYVRNGALVLFAAVLMIGCAGDKAARQDVAQQDAAKKEAQKNKADATNLPASIFQGYNVTGSRF